MTWLFHDVGMSTRLVFIVVIALVGCLGLLAIVSPRAFARLSQASGRWVDTSQLVSKLDARYDVDGRVLSHSRLFGTAVLMSAVLLGYLLLS